MKTTIVPPILRIVLPYVVLAGTWILLSDRLVALLSLDASEQTQWSIYKGLVFVLVTALLLTSLLRRELNARERNQAVLRENEERLRLLGDNLPDSYVYQYTQDADGAPRFIYLSTGVERLHGVKAEDVLRDANLLRRQIAPDVLPDMRAAEAESFRNMTDFVMETRVCRSDGQWRWMRMCSRPLLTHDGRVVWDGVATDITDHKQAETAIRELNAGLEQRVEERTAELAVARDRAEAADRLKSAFLATMSHELRTPLNSIIGFTGILLKELAGPLNAEQRKQLEMVRDSSWHLLALINDVLDISKIEANQLMVRCEPFDLRAAVMKVVGIVRPLAEKKALTLRTENVTGIGEWVSDPQRVEQILMNLLNNAIKFTERGTVTLTAEALPDALRLAVADTGIGIKPEDLGTLFQPFRQIDSGLMRHHEGTGLGLAICRRLASLLGGEIHVASEWGKGSVFTLTLPVKGRGTS